MTMRRLNITVSFIICLLSVYVCGFESNGNFKKLIASFQSSLSKGSRKSLCDDKGFKNKIVSILTSMAILLPIGNNIALPAQASSYSYALSNEIYKNVNINFPSDDFWYPPFMIGKWNTQLKFTGATFTDKISPELLADPGHLPGFDKYSVIFIPDIGNDLKDAILSYVQLDSHPREDHPSNLRALVQASSISSSSASISSSIPLSISSPTSSSSSEPPAAAGTSTKAIKDDNDDDIITHIDSAPYFFQKAPDWFHSPANKWKIKYHDSQGSGVVDLYTKKRNIQVFAGAVETFELFHQTHDRTSATAGSKSNSRTHSTTYSDYALNWRLAVPAALRDEFIAVEDLSKTNTILGTLDVFVYLQPTSILYAATSSTPAGVYSYDVVMDRIVDRSVLGTSSGIGSSSSSSSSRTGGSSDGSNSNGGSRNKISVNSGSGSVSISGSSTPQLLQVVNDAGDISSINNNNNNNNYKFSNTEQQQQQQQQTRPNNSKNPKIINNRAILTNIPTTYTNKKYITGTVTGKGFYDSSGNPVYPFIWRDAGPIDSLKDYFGY